VAIFKDGLQEEVKDELVRIDQPTDLSKMIKLTVKINNQLYEQQQEQNNT
jgi:hypothetical protein